MSEEIGGSGTHHAPGGKTAAASARGVAGMIKGAARMFAPSLVIGLAAPVIFPPLRRAAKPLVKACVKSALSLSESVKEATANAKEQMTDLLAEVKAERAREADDAAARPKDKI
jgi:hypothetical protein